MSLLSILIIAYAGAGLLTSAFVAKINKEDDLDLVDVAIFVLLWPMIWALIFFGKEKQ